MVIQTVTSPAEARLAAEAGADALAVQASAAGGHSGTLTPRVVPAPVPLPDLLGQVRQAVSLPLITAGGIATPAAMREALSASAAAVAVGTGLLRAVEGDLGTLPGRARRPSAPADRRDPGVHWPPARGLRDAFTDRYSGSATSAAGGRPAAARASCSTGRPDIRSASGAPPTGTTPGGAWRSAARSPSGPTVRGPAAPDGGGGAAGEPPGVARRRPA